MITKMWRYLTISVGTSIARGSMAGDLAGSDIAGDEAMMPAAMKDNNYEDFVPLYDRHQDPYEYLEDPHRVERIEDPHRDEADPQPTIAFLEKMKLIDEVVRPNAIKKANVSILQMRSAKKESKEKRSTVNESREGCSGGRCTNIPSENAGTNASTAQLEHDKESESRNHPASNHAKQNASKHTKQQSQEAQSTQTKTTQSMTESIQHSITESIRTLFSPIEMMKDAWQNFKDSVSNLGNIVSDIKSVGEEEGKANTKTPGGTPKVALIVFENITAMTFMLILGLLIGTLSTKLYQTLFRLLGQKALPQLKTIIENLDGRGRWFLVPVLLRDVMYDCWLCSCWGLTETTCISITNKLQDTPFRNIPGTALTGRLLNRPSSIYCFKYGLWCSMCPRLLLLQRLFRVADKRPDKASKALSDIIQERTCRLVQNMVEIYGCIVSTFFLSVIPQRIKNLIDDSSFLDEVLETDP